VTEEQSQLIKNAQILFKPQEGGQTLFLSSPADLIIYGGQAGGGKTYGELLFPLRWRHVSGFDCVIFRRQFKQLTLPGGLWDESKKIYPHFGGVPNVTQMRWKFPSGAKISFYGMELEDDKEAHQGGQYSVILFDEGTHFTETQFSYMFSRNRSTSGVRSRIAITCNPDPDSWLLKFVDWYLLPLGTPDHEKRGLIRYCARYGDEWVFGSSPAYLEAKYGIAPEHCTSYTFIYATLDDNPALLKKDPNYVRNLMMLGEAESAALLSGNWRIKKSGKIFKQEDFQIFTQTPRYTKKIIVMDTAQKTKEANDYSVMQCWVKGEKGIYLIDQLRGKWEFPELELMSIAFITKHSMDLSGIYIEDAVSGTALIQALRRKMNRPFYPVLRKKDKYTRAYDTQGYIKSGYVWINPTAESNYFIEYVNEMVGFAADMSHKHDDQADCTFDAVDVLLIKGANDERVDNRENIQPRIQRIC
jgi:predicted phage terminase large subunit-like protein